MCRSSASPMRACNGAARTKVSVSASSSQDPVLDPELLEDLDITGWLLTNSKYPGNVWRDLTLGDEGGEEGVRKPKHKQIDFGI